MTPNQIAKLIKQTDTEAIEEREQIIIINARLTNNENRDKWLEISNNVPECLTNITINYQGTDDHYIGKETPNDQDLFTIVLEKIQKQSELLILFGCSLHHLKDTLPEVDKIRIAEFDPSHTFTTYRNRFEQWNCEESTDFRPHESLPNPRAYVNEFSASNEVPTDIRPWLLLEKPETEGIAFNQWSKITRRPLIASISERVSSKAGDVIYHFAGPPACSFNLDQKQLDGIAEWLTEGASWVYTNEKRDADARHLLLANEWARSFRCSNIEEIGKQSLESAQSAYKAYIKSQSRDTLKALSDLRKVVLEETQSISNRANEFAKSMWKDLAVAVVPFVVNMISDKTGSENQAISTWLAYGAAIFLFLSIGIQIYLNERWISQQTFARGIWKLEINTALTQKELKEVSENPISNSVYDFRIIEAIIFLFYLTIILFLINYATGNYFFNTAFK